jgi:hypothetical protein
MAASIALERRGFANFDRVATPLGGTELPTQPIGGQG